MGKVMKCVTAAVIAGFVVMVIVMILTVTAKRGGDLYNAKMKIAFNAAMMEYAEGDPETTVRVRYGGTEYELNPDNYATVSFYLRRAALPAYLPRKLNRDNPVVITFCGADRAEVYRVDGDLAVVVFETGGEKMKMRVKADELWADLTSVIEKGHNGALNPVVGTY